MEELVQFIDESLNQGFSKEEIKRKLLGQNWAEEEIESAFLAMPTVSRHFTLTKELALKITAFFLIASVILLFSIAVLRYELGIMDYNIIDPVTGESLQGYCSDPSCSEAKQGAWIQVKNNLTQDILTAVFLSGILSLIYFFSHNKRAVLWVANGLFFLFVIILFILWISFI